MLRCLLLCQFVLVLASQSGSAQQLGDDANPVDHSSAYDKVVLADQPDVWWSFDDASPLKPFVKTGSLEVRVEGGVSLKQPGPMSAASVLFSSENRGIEFNGKKSVIKVTDPGSKSVLDFDQGEALTLEAWVKIKSISDGRYVYVVGKGRTNNKGVAAGNQSYALRLEGRGGKASVSFLFRNREDAAPASSDFHRWTTTAGFLPDSQWHHVAVSYRFGTKDSVRGYIDGRELTGEWDLKGATDKAPVVDDDELWIGSSMGVSESSTFEGSIDEVAIYRKALSLERMQARVIRRPTAEQPPLPELSSPRDAVLVEVIEGIADKPNWDFSFVEPSDIYFEPAFAFFDLPSKYSDKGIRIDRSSPLILRARCRLTYPVGKYRLLVRTLRFGRLFIDGKLVVATPVRNHRSDGHGDMYDLTSKLAPGSRPLFPGSAEEQAVIELDGAEHEFRFEIYVGGQKRRLELGETSVSIVRDDAVVAGAGASAEGASLGRSALAVGNALRIISPSTEIALTDASWEAYEIQRRNESSRIDQSRRREVSKPESAYWAARHQTARELMSQREPIAIPALIDGETAGNAIDHFVQAQLRKAKLQPAALCDDWTFLRRASFDVLGTPPSPEIIREFMTDTRPDRRARLIDRLLAHPSWADHWVGYWQDVLSENPNLVNPTLNNTGPFRWWIHESFFDNKPMDRFASELIQMDGSSHFGGPAGFAIASENDVPFAAKAHIIGQAFLALEMKCARCHDAPYHDFEQRDLFSLAAMLRRGPQEVPKTSLVPADSPKAALVKVTLKSGEKIAASWPFKDQFGSDVPPSIVRNANDPRDEAALRVTSPLNDRFAEVLVNRVWKRYFGRGIVEPVDDWEHAEPSHPELLKYLARELVSSGYDLQQLARLMLNSQAYQRAEIADASPSVALFGSARSRRLTAEQVVDSVFAVSGKEFRAGDLNIDVDGSRQFTQSLNLGIPRRAWMFASLSNERDRPSLSLPFAQPFVTVLETFGWQGSRQGPQSDREHDANVLQPAILANGVLGQRLTRVSDDSAFVELALKDRPASELITDVFERMLTRRPSSAELAIYLELLDEGFADRIDAEQLKAAPNPQPRTRTGVGWSNHLKPEASAVQIAAQEVVRQGDPATKKLKAAWRERFEDMLWSLLNSPEFVFVP